MAQQSYAVNAERPFIADPHSIARTGGAQVDFTAWQAGYQNSNGDKVIPAGTICAVSLSGDLIPPTAGGADAEVILATPAIENSLSDAKSGYGTIVGGVIYQNLLPDTANPDFDAMLTALETAGTGFKFVTYGDTRDGS